jgi:hypothetical protein
MDNSCLLAETLALELLARDGIATIWQLNLAAADAYRSGHPRAAQSMLEIADAAEQAWLRAEGTRDIIGTKGAITENKF